MTILDKMIGFVSPTAELRRVRARMASNVARRVLANYDAATVGRRGKSWKVSATDADGAAARRQRLAWISRDMIRNTPFAARAQHVIASNVVAAGILPKAVFPADSPLAIEWERDVKRHFDSSSIDADGQSTLYGLQKLAVMAVVDAGEVLVRRRRRRNSDGLPLPFQIQVIEADFLDTAKEGAADRGGMIREGIEFDRLGRRVAYWLFDEHPGSTSTILRRGGASKRVAASEIIHIYRQDRPGQRRGVSWFAPVALALQDFADNQDAKLMQQKIAACFAAFVVDLDGGSEEVVGGGAVEDDPISSIQPGAVYHLDGTQEVKFATPPSADGFDEFSRVVLRSVAMGLGITYESLTGDLSTVNFSSARIGRLEMNRNVEAWQWHMIVPQMLEKIAVWMLEAWAMKSGRAEVLDVVVTWSPPPLTMADPRLEAAAAKGRRALGLTSRQGEQRALGFDPDEVHREQLEDLVRDAELAAATPKPDTTDTPEKGQTDE